MQAMNGLLDPIDLRFPGTRCKKTCLFHIIILILLEMPAVCSDHTRTIQQFTTEQGLSQSSISSILQDSRGFVLTEVGIDVGVHVIDTLSPLFAKRGIITQIRHVEDDREKVPWRRAAGECTGTTRRRKKAEGRKTRTCIKCSAALRRRNSTSPKSGAVVTVANARQAEAYGTGPPSPPGGTTSAAGQVLVVPDMEGRRIGSGASTVQCLLTIVNRETAERGGVRNFAEVEAVLRRFRILILHAGGDAPFASILGVQEDLRPVADVPAFRRPHRRHQFSRGRGPPRAAGLSGRLAGGHIGRQRRTHPPRLRRAELQPPQPSARLRWAVKA